MNFNVCIVDDDIQIASMLQDILNNKGFISTIFTQVSDFLNFDLANDDVILLDLMMPDIDGVEVIRILSERECLNSIVLLSGYDQSVLNSVEKLAKELSLNVLASMTKPINIELLLELVGANKEPANQIFTGTNSNSAINVTAEDIRQALREDLLTLHYQPQIDIKSGEVIGVEALLRWPHDEFGWVPPMHFIPIAEKNNMMGELTAQVVEKAIAQSELWQNEGLKIQISVNISAENIVSLTLPDQLSEMMARRALDSTTLTLELTESSLVDGLSKSLDILARLRMKGFGLSIDDFGTGYSSLSQLHRIPFSELKIDQSFVKSMDIDQESEAIVRTCIILGHELNMDVVAEGVETENVLHQLEDMGCDIAQGYFIAKPMPANELSQWIEKRTNKHSH